MDKPTTFTEQFAAEYARNAVPNMLKAIASIKRYNRFVLLGALLTSYLHQAHYLWTQNAGYFAYLVPLIFDAAMVSMLTVVRTSGIARDAKRGAMVVFAAAALLSATINFAAPGSLGLRLVFALVVVLVIGVELVAGRIRPDFAAIEAEAAALLAAANDLATATAEDGGTRQPAATPTDTTNPRADEKPEPDPASLVDEQPQPVTVPAHLIPAARFAIVNHRQNTGRPITVEELADRLDITPAIAGRLLHTIEPPAATAQVNGARVLEGAQR